MRTQTDVAEAASPRDPVVDGAKHTNPRRDDEPVAVGASASRLVQLAPAE